MAKRDYYEILGVPRSVSGDELKKTFRKLALKYHPDKNPGDKVAEDRFKEASEAYEVLSDPDKRKMYDQYGHMAMGQAGGPGRSDRPFEGFNFRYSGQGGQGGDFNQDIFGEFFGDLFGNSGSQRSKAEFFRKNRGADLRYTLMITLEEAFGGVEKTISFIRKRNQNEEPAKLAVSIPAGVREGQRLKLRGEGDSGVGGGAAGDLYVIIQIQDHPLFKRKENDVTLDLPISFVDAILGAQVEIPTLQGKALLKIPEGCHSGQVLRLKGRGFSSAQGGVAGDMLIKILVDVPPKLTEEQRALVTQLSSLASQGPLVREFQDKVRNLLAVRRM